MPLFESRLDAGLRLAEALAPYRRRHPLVLAIPRGGVVIGAVVAEALDGELDVVLVRKLPSPYSAEVGVGAVDESGWTYVAPGAAQAGADRGYLLEEKARQLEVLRRRRAMYSVARPPADPQGRLAIVVDDGIASGASMIAALRWVRARDPSRLVCAVPLAAAASLERVRPYADEVVCLETVPDVGVLRHFYRRFPPVEDRKVVARLALYGRRAARLAAS